MKCKDCGAHLPYGAYGHIRCEFCNTPNYVPIPGEKEEAEEKRGTKKEPTIEKDTQKGSSIKGLIKKIIIIGMLLLVVLVVIGMIVPPSPDPQPYTYTPKPTYTPTTTRPLTTTPPPITNVPSVSIISDSFNSNVNDWLMGSRSDDFATVEWSLTDGKYRWDVKAHKGVNWHVQPAIEPLSDFHLTVDAQQSSGAESAAYGSVFRLIDRDNFYYFAISNTQMYTFSLQYKNEWIQLIEWTTSSAIRPGEVNKIEIIAEGSYFRFLINDQFISDVYDDRLTSGKAGLSIDLYDAGDTGVFEFDNFEISASAPSTTTPTPTTTAPITTTSPALGARTNPASIGYALSTEFEEWDDKYETKLTVLEVIRGTDAWNRLIEANMFNSPPKEDHEYILAKIKFEYLSGPNIDTSYDVNAYSFNVISSEGKEYEVPMVVEPEPAMDTSLYPGASHEGWTAYEIGVEDSQPLLTFGRDYQGRGGIWFKLYEPPTALQETTSPTTTVPKTTPVMIEDNYPLEIITYSVIEELPHYKINVEGTVKNVGKEAVNKGWIFATFTLTQGRSSKEMRVFFTDDPFLSGETQNFRFRTDMTKDIINSIELNTGAG